MVIAKSADAAPTGVVAVAELLALLGSGVGVPPVDATLAVLAVLAPTKFKGTLKVEVMTRGAPGTTVPIVQGKVPVQPPPLFEMKVRPVGVGSVTRTAAASLGPLFVTVMV